MRIIRAHHLGMCFGVRDAIALAHSQATHEPLTILGELVHNQTVLEDLRTRGIATETEPAKVRTRRAMITAHGASEKRIAEARAQGLEIFEGTCPLVHHAHRAVRQFVAEGYHPVIIGKRDHVEVRGMTEDLEEYDVILREADIAQVRPRTKFGLAAQTTQPIDRVEKLVEHFRKVFSGSEVRFADTVCQPTKQRQRAARDLARQCDVVIVVGGSNSNNTRELVQSCAEHCSHVHHVEFPADVRGSWFEGARVAGITAGTSTPDHLIDAVEAEIRRHSAN